MLGHRQWNARAPAVKWKMMTEAAESGLFNDRIITFKIAFLTEIPVANRNKSCYYCLNLKYTNKITIHMATCGINWFLEGAQNHSAHKFPTQFQY